MSRPRGLSRLSKTVAEMDKVTQQSAVNAEEGASASEEMNAQAEQMKVILEELVALVGGNERKVGSKQPARNALTCEAGGYGVRRRRAR